MEDSRLKSCYSWPKVTKFRIDFNGTEVVRGQRRRTSKNWPEYLNPLGMFLSLARSSRVSYFRQSRTKQSISIIKVAQKVGTKEDLWGDKGKKLRAGKELSRDKIKKASSEYTREARIRPLKRWPCFKFIVILLFNRLIFFCWEYFHFQSLKNLKVQSTFYNLRTRS